MGTGKNSLYILFNVEFNEPKPTSECYGIEKTNRNRCPGSRHPLDRCAKTQHRQNRRQTMESNISVWPHSPEWHALCSHRPRSTGQQLNFRFDSNFILTHKSKKNRLINKQNFSRSINGNMKPKIQLKWEPLTSVDLSMEKPMKRGQVFSLSIETYLVEWSDSAIFFS